jgi:hypothetical protein
VNVEAEMSKSHPQGSVDRLNTFELFESGNGLGIPLIPKIPKIPKTSEVQKETSLPDVLIPHKQRLNHQLSLEDEEFEVAVHFFLEDYRFEPVWSTPRKGASYVRGVGAALSPDFSLYRDWLLALQVFNVYRNRWCGAYWSSLGVRIIPTVSWSDEDSYPFCFLGVEEGSAVAISSVGVDLDNAEERRLFTQGCTEMIERIQPATVMLQAEAFPDELLRESGLDTVELRKYPPRWSNIRRARRELREVREGKMENDE